MPGFMKEVFTKNRNDGQANGTERRRFAAMKADTQSFYLNAVRRVLVHLHTHLDDAVALDALGQLAGLSPFHFHRVFRGLVGETPVEVTRRLRLERAAHQLQTSDFPVTRIAFQAGYESHEAFTRVFRSQFGTTPTAFRRRPTARTVLPARCGVHFHTTDIGGAFVPRSHNGEGLMTVDVITLPDLRLAGVRHRGPYNQINSAFQELGAKAGAAGLFTLPDALLVGLYHHDPEVTPGEDLRSEAAVSIPASVSIPEGLEELHVRGGRYARVTHVGGFEQIGDHWSRFVGELLPASGLVVRDGPALEIYRSDMRATPPSDWRTDLVVPLRD